MRTVTATEAARNFSRMLDLLEHESEEIVVLRNNQPVAKLVPGAPRMTALEALGDLHRTLPDAEGGAWPEDASRMDRRLRKQVRDPWARSSTPRSGRCRARSAPARSVDVPTVTGEAPVISRRP